MRRISRGYCAKRGRGRRRGTGRLGCLTGTAYLQDQKVNRASEAHGQWGHLEVNATGRDRVNGWLSVGYHVSGVSRPGRPVLNRKCACFRRNISCRRAAKRPHTLSIAFPPLRASLFRVGGFGLESLVGCVFDAYLRGRFLLCRWSKAKLQNETRSDTHTKVFGGTQAAVDPIDIGVSASCGSVASGISLDFTYAAIREYGIKLNIATAHGL
jgi:hypothetical protein